MDGKEDGPERYSAADLAPAEFDPIPPDASRATAVLYAIATVLQIGWLFAAAWGTNRVVDPDVGTGDKVLTVVILILVFGVCIEVWGEAYQSSARDKELAALERRDKPGGTKPGGKPGHKKPGHKTAGHKNADRKTADRKNSKAAKVGKGDKKAKADRGDRAD